MWNRRMAGVTLVELIIAMVIVGAALAGLVAVYSRANIASADPLVAQQMVAIAEGMMEEIMLKPYAPEGGNTAARATFNDVRDYDKFASAGVYTVAGAKVPGLERYGVTVAVEQVTLTGMAKAGDALRIRVTVTYGGESLTLSGWRTNPVVTP